MRYFVIQEREIPIAVVFHNYRDSSFYCRSAKESFLKIFNAVCSKSSIKFSREADSLRALYYGASEYDWIDNVLDQICGDQYSIRDQKEIVGTEANVDAVIREYLAS